MLKDHPVLAGKLVHAWKESTFREMTDEDKNVSYEGQRYDYIIDENDVPLGVVSDRYKLVLNSELVSALDMAADQRGLVVEPVRAGYSRGRGLYTFKVPSLEYKVGRDHSVTMPQIVVKNDYRGGGGLVVQSGYFRQVCTNGAVVGTIAYHSYARHVGSFNVMDFMAKALDVVQDRFEVDRLLAEKYAATTITAGQELVRRLEERTPARYQNDLRRAVRDNVLGLGDNAWAYLQAVSEIATHRMQLRANGRERERFNMAADGWQLAAMREIADFAEIK